MANWLIDYNTKIPHHSLLMKTPVQYLIENNPQCQMLWTNTSPWNNRIFLIKYWLATQAKGDNKLQYFTASKIGMFYIQIISEQKILVTATLTRCMLTFYRSLSLYNIDKQSALINVTQICNDL
jgi:hypothetical protein